MPSPRTLLVLGRTSNLPTVWSNCLAGWWLGGGGNFYKLPLLLLGSTLLYVGGMYLNDAFDAGFDAQFRRERPIPSGAIQLAAVWKIAIGLLATGFLLLFACGKITSLIALMLILCIVIYDAVHKLITLSPLIMAGCRFLLYLLAASVGASGVTGSAIWSGMALAAYVVGLSYLARKESTRATLQYWPCLLMAVPIILAMVVNTNAYREAAYLLSAVLGLWVARCLRYTFGGIDRNIGRTVSGLLAGIVWVDLLAIANCPRQFAAIMVALFLSAIFFQRYVPAT